MRRKILSFILALTLMAGMGSIAYAEEIDGSGNWHGRADVGEIPAIGVYGNYKANEPTIEYCVNVAWDDMIFKFGYSQPKEWDPGTHQHVIADGTQYVWTGEGHKKTCTVTVTNKSNARVNVTAEYKSNETFTNDGFNVQLLNGTPTVGDSTITAKVTLGDASDAKDEELTGHDFVLSAGFTTNKPTKMDEFNAVIGTMTITVNKYEGQ